MLSEIKLSLPSNDNFTMREMIYNYRNMYRFVDNSQKKLYNENGFYAKNPVNGVAISENQNCRYREHITWNDTLNVLWDKCGRTGK